MMEINSQEEELTEKIIRAIIKVHQTLGPGFLENIYHKALTIELRKHGLGVEVEKMIDVFYDDELIGRHRLDLLVENKIVLELKTVENLGKVHYAQMRSYLKASGCPIGILVNFADQKADFRRIE